MSNGKHAGARDPGWIAVDLDGTLAHYNGWLGVDHIGAPIPRMARRVRAWLRQGRTVKIFTARVDQSRVDWHEAALAVQRWTLLHFGTALEVTNVKTFSMAELWDDRAVRVEKNTGKRLK